MSRALGRVAAPERAARRPRLVSVIRRAVTIVRAAGRASRSSHRFCSARAGRSRCCSHRTRSRAIAAVRRTALRRAFGVVLVVLDISRFAAAVDAAFDAGLAVSRSVALARARQRLEEWVGWLDADGRAVRGLPRADSRSNSCSGIDDCVRVVSALARGRWSRSPRHVVVISSIARASSACRATAGCSASQAGLLGLVRSFDGRVGRLGWRRRERRSVRAGSRRIIGAFGLVLVRAFQRTRVQAGARPRRTRVEVPLGRVAQPEVRSRAPSRGCSRATPGRSPDRRSARPAAPSCCNYDWRHDDRRSGRAGQLPRARGDAAPARRGRRRGAQARAARRARRARDPGRRVDDVHAPDAPLRARRGGARVRRRRSSGRAPG